MVLTVRSADGGREGVTGRIVGSGGVSPSARRMNCRGVRGEPGEDVVFIDWGLLPLGVERANDGSSGGVP